jgi:thiamine pyrophosphate-dependent acetolactate synthase large subunit-like protein
MTTHAATDRLWSSLHALRDDVLTLRLQAVEDHPRDEPNKLIEDVGAAAESLAGWAEEALDAAAQALSAAERPADIARLYLALDCCGVAVQRFARQLQAELATTRIDELTVLATEGGRELRAWIRAIKQALDQVQDRRDAAQAALTLCWRELAERVTPGSAPVPADTTRRT